MSLLVLFYDKKRSQLIAFSHAGDTFSDRIISKSYVRLLKTLEKNKSTMKKQDIVASLSKTPHVWHGGKKIKDGQR